MVAALDPSHVEHFQRDVVGRGDERDLFSIGRCHHGEHACQRYREKRLDCAEVAGRDHPKIVAEHSNLDRHPVAHAMVFHVLAVAAGQHTAVFQPYRLGIGLAALRHQGGCNEAFGFVCTAQQHRRADQPQLGFQFGVLRCGKVFFDQRQLRFVALGLQRFDASIGSLVKALSFWPTMPLALALAGIHR